MPAGAYPLPKGFWANGITCGIKEKKKKDLALFYSEVPAQAAAVFTANQAKAAPVLVSKEHLTENARPDQVGGKRPTRIGRGKTENGIQAIIANSGCANACTGKQGLNDAKEMCKLTAHLLGIKPDSVLVASTGAIGRYLPMPEIRQGIKKLTRLTNNGTRKTDKSAPITAVKAIMTTDTFPKVSRSTFNVQRSTVTIWACAKGAGMIHPDLATLLCFILTDIVIDRRLLEKALKTAVSQSFNCITVDGDTSTNDTVFLLANGSAGNQAIRREDSNFRKFQDRLNKVTLELAKMVAKDGEGATKLVKIVVENARNSEEAKKVAKTIALSPLVKTAFFGADPNWGRIIGAVGRSGVRITPEKINLYFNSLSVSHQGIPVIGIEKKARKILQQREFTVRVDLNQGKAKADIYTCDLSTEYVKINSAYST